jgi:glycosyltransferase involved in cell wall biosynthesis
MNILIYTHSFKPHVGGVETIVMSLARGLAEIRSGDSAPQVTIATAAPIGEMNDVTLPFRIVRQPSAGELIKLFHDADLIHLAGPALFPLFLAWIMRKPVVVEHHGFQTICPNGQLFYEPEQMLCPDNFMSNRHLKCLQCNVKSGKLNSFELWLLTFPRRQLCKMVSANVAPTFWLAKTLRLPRTTTIVHGLRPLASQSPPTVSLNKPPIFVFQGRLVGTKGVTVLLAAAEKLKARGHSFQLKIIGEGPDRAILQETAARVGLAGCVDFLGRLSDERIDRAVAEATAVIVPSLAGEVFGLVAAENMLRGRLVIASDIGALREVVGETGLFFSPGDDIGLLQRMEEVLMDISKASALGQKASERATKLFDEGLMTLQHFSLYEAIISCAK